MKFLILISFVLCSLSYFSEGGEKSRTCRIVFVNPPRGAPKEVQLFDGVVSRKVVLPDKNLSQVIKLPKGDLVLGMALDPVLKLKDLPKDAPTVKIPAQVADFYLIVVSDPENKTLPLRILPVNVGDKKAKLGQTLWINLTDHAIIGTFDSDAHTIPPKKRLISKAPLPVSGFYQAEFFYQPNGEGEFLPVMRKSWWFDAKSKHIGFIVNSGRALPRILTFRDKPAPVVKKKVKP